MCVGCYVIFLFLLCSIFDFQVSGPSNMSKTLTSLSNGVIMATLTWIPQETDLFRHVPVCFTAETPHR